MKVLKFEDFLYEDGDGGGVASATAGSSAGMGNVVAPTVSTNGMTNTYSGNGNPTDAAPRGSGDIVAHSMSTSSKKRPNKPKKRKFQLTPKNVRMSGTSPKESMYVTSFKDWSGSGVNESNEVGLWTIFHGLGGGFGGAIADDEPFEGTEDQANAHAWLASCDDYDNYVGSNGLREIQEIMEEDGVDEEEAEEIFNEERETWLDYWVEKYK